MSRYYKITPEGTRDLLFEESRALREVQGRLSRLFVSRGYREVFTPGLEYFDVFAIPGAAIAQQEMYKATDNHGRLLVFRPDSTLPMARMAASRLQNEPRPLRLFYDQSVFRNRPDLSGRSDENPQMGIELMGAGGLRADLEAVSLAAEALRLVSADFRIEIGHALLFRALARRLVLSPEETEELREAIESKNYGGLSVLLDSFGDDPAAQAMQRLPRLFGGEEVLAQAQQWLTDQESRTILEEIRVLVNALKQMGLEDHLMVDLGLVQRNDYYTGAVFSAYVEGQGDAILSGGRYDGLCEKFGQEMPAIGFAMDLEAASALIAETLSPEAPAEILIHGEDGYETRAQQIAGETAAGGVRCEASVFPDLDTAVAYARQKGIPQVLAVGKEKRVIRTKEGEA